MKRAPWLMRSAAVVVAVALTVTAPAVSANSAGASDRAVSAVVTRHPLRATADTLRSGSTGIHVAHVQQLLASLGYHVVVDGLFGPQTERAVRHFQRVNGLTPDGVVGPHTWDALLSLRAPASKASPRPVRAHPTEPSGAPDVEQVIRDAWPDDLEDRALAIAHRESRLVPTARNSCCYGLFQIHYRAHAAWLGPIGVTSAAELLDAETNARAAYALYLLDGWAPWAL